MRRLLKTFLPKTCDEFETDLVLYAYGKIATAERSGIEAHLDACASCRDRQDQLLQELATAPLDFPPPQFWDDYSREMRQKLAVVDENKQRTRTWIAPFSVGGIAALAAGLVLVVALGVTLKDSIFSSGDEPREDGMMKVLPIVQNLEFFESMHYLEMMGQEPGDDVKSSNTRKEHGVIVVWARESPRRESAERPTGSPHSSHSEGGDEFFTPWNTTRGADCCHQRNIG